MPYSKINPDDMILRDHLAFDRTVLANERTVLAYFRTSLGLLAAGGTLVKIFPDEVSMVTLGSVLIALGILADVIGFWRFMLVKRKLSLIYKKLDEK